MKKFTTLKTLLVGLMALGATSAWAQTTTTYDFEDGIALFTADSRISATVVSDKQTIYSTDFTIDGKAVYFTGAGNAQNGYCFAHYDFSSLCDQAAKVKVEFEAVLGNGARSRISIGDASVRGNTGNSSKVTYNDKGAIFMYGTEKAVGYINGTNNGDLLTALTQKWLKVTVEVDEIEKTYTYSIVDMATKTELYNNGEEPIAFWSTDATNCTQIDVFGYINNSQMALIDNLVITVTKDERQQADYTVNFLDGSSNAIKEAVTRSGAVGDAITLIPADKDPLWNSDNTMKYLYQSDNTEGLTIASDGSTVVNVIYADAPTYTYSVVDNFGSTLGSGSAFEGENANFYVPYYVFADGKFYQSPTLSSGSLSYGQGTISNLTADTEITVTYTEEESSNVVFFSEAENLTDATPYEDGYTQIRMSNGKVGYFATQTAFVTLPAGIYTLTAASRSGTTSFYAGGKVIGSVESTGAVVTTTSDPFTLTAETDIYTSIGSVSKYFDYVIIRKTGDVELPETMTVNVTAAGYATYSSEYALDLSKVSGIEAYTATIDGSNVTFTKQTGAVAPATGLLIKAAEGSYDIPVATSGATIANNALVAMLSASDVVAGSYVLMTKPYVGFFKTTSSFSCTANTAYIAPLPAEARIVLPGNDATAIKAIEAEKNGEVYNLAGQRVVKAQKGLYIMNGKKVVVK